MKRLIFCILFAFVGLMSVSAQEHIEQSDSIELINKIQYAKLMADSCLKLARHNVMTNYEGYEYADEQYKFWRDKQKKYMNQYKMQFQQIARVNYTIKDAGIYLKRSANCDIACLCIGIGGAGITALVATQAEKPDFAYIPGVLTGGTAFALYIASIVNKKKAGKVMQNLQFTGNGVRYNF